MSNQTIADSELTATETEIKEYNYWVGLKQALERLETNADFQKVILEGYFKNHAINGVSRLASPYVKTNGYRPDVMEQLVAVSQLQHFFIDIKSMGTTEEDDEETVEE